MKLKVVELFAGVGGFRLGLEGWKGKSASSGYTKKIKKNKHAFSVVWSNQWEPMTKRQHATEVYESKWSGGHCGDDICQVQTTDIPDHDLLVGGFPCQDYSVATTLRNSKGLRGKKGVLWWQIERILREKVDAAPSYVFLENVDRLLGSPATQRGRDFAIMLASLSDLGYAVEWRVVNAADYGMPQKRKRIFIMGYKKGTALYDQVANDLDKFIFNGVLADALPIGVSEKNIHAGKIKGSLKTVSSKFNIDTPKKSLFSQAGVMIDRKYWTTKPEIEYSGEHKLLKDVVLPSKDVDSSFFIDKESLKRWEYEKGAKKIKRVNKKTGFEYMFSEGKMSFPDSLDKPSRTIITGEGGASPSRFKHVIKQGRRYRRLTPVELERLNMFPDNHTYLEDVSDSKRAFFMGNALVVGVIERIGQSLINRIE